MKLFKGVFSKKSSESTRESSFVSISAEVS